MATHTTKIYKERIDKGPGHTQITQERVDTDGNASDTVQNAPRYVYYESAPAASRVIYYLLDIVEVLLAARFFLRLLGANPGAAFTQFIYSLTNPLVAPFRGIFPNTATQGFVFDWPTVIAAIVYALVAWILARIVWSAQAPSYRT